MKIEELNNEEYVALVERMMDLFHNHFGTKMMDDKLFGAYFTLFRTMYGSMPYRELVDAMLNGIKGRYGKCTYLNGHEVNIWISRSKENHYR